MKTRVNDEAQAVEAEVLITAAHLQWDPGVMALLCSLDHHGLVVDMDHLMDTLIMVLERLKADDAADLADTASVVLLDQVALTSVAS